LKEFEFWFAPETGQFWKDQQKLVASFATRTDRGNWQHPQPIKELRATPALLRFLNAAQRVTDAFFSLNGKTAAVQYAIRPRFTNPNQLVDLKLDGVSQTFDRSSFQRDYDWPARGNILSAEGLVRSTNNTIRNSQFGSERGPWAVFRFFGRADHVGANLLRWTRGWDGAALDVPVELELLYLGETNVFATSLFEGLTCPTKAVER
jgi:type VI protein secretion system component VasK